MKLKRGWIFSAAFYSLATVSWLIPQELYLCHRSNLFRWNWFYWDRTLFSNFMIVLGCIHCLKRSLVRKVTLKENFFTVILIISIPGKFFEILDFSLSSWSKTGPFDAHFKIFLLPPVLWSFDFSLSPPLETMPEGREDEKQMNHFLIVSSSGKWLSRRYWSQCGNSFGLCFISFICIVSEMF